MDKQAEREVKRILSRLKKEIGRSIGSALEASMASGGEWLTEDGEYAITIDDIDHKTGDLELSVTFSIINEDDEEVEYTAKFLVKISSSVTFYELEEH